MKVLKIVANVLVWMFLVFMCCLLVVNIYFLYENKVRGNTRATFFGYAYQIGQNYSMQPTLNPNDFIVTKSQGSYKVGDIISFADRGKVTTHRIVEVTANGYITRGDSVTIISNDPEITKDAVIGKVVLSVPHIGAVLIIMNNPLGAFLIVAIIVLCYLLLRCLANQNPKHALAQPQDADKAPKEQPNETPKE